MAFANFKYFNLLYAGSSSKKKAIIGGVVGGLGALFITTLFVLFKLSRRPKEDLRGNTT